MNIRVNNDLNKEIKFDGETLIMQDKNIGNVNNLSGTNATLTENVTASWFNGNLNTKNINNILEISGNIIYPINTDVIDIGYTDINNNSNDKRFNFGFFKKVKATTGIFTGNITLDNTFIKDVSAIQFSDGSLFNNIILNDKIDTINSNISTLQTEMNHVEGNISILQGNISTLQTEMNHVDGNITILQGNVSTLQTEMNHVEGNISTLQTEMNHVEGNISTLQTEMNHVEGNITILQGNVSTLQTEMNHVEGNISTLQTEMNHVEGNISILQGNISTLQTEMNHVEGNITILQGNVSTLQTEMNHVEGNISTLQTEMNHVEGNITILQGNVSTLHNEMNAVEGNITLLQGNITLVQGNVSTLLSNIDQSVKTTSNVIFNKLTISDTVIINGNLTVRGNKTIVDSVEHVITDTLITLNSKGLSDPIGIEGNTNNGNIIQFVFDQTNNYWHTGGKSLKANIIGDISGDTGNLNNLNMFGNINLNNNYWINDVSGIKFADGSILTSNVANVNLNNYADVSFGNMDISGNINFINGNTGIYYNNYNYIEKRNSKLELFVYNDPLIQIPNEIEEYLKIYGSNLFLDSSSGLIIIGNDSSKNSENCIQMNSRTRFNGLVDFKSPVYFNANAELYGTMNINQQGLSINGGTGSYFKDCILRVLATSRENLNNSRLGIHNPGEVEAGLDVNSESIFRDTITANNKLNLTGNLSIAKSINYNWNNYGEDLSGDLSNDQFGSSVAINNIGNIIAIGAPFSDINGNQSGLVRIYNHNSLTWQQIGSDLSGTNGEHFGYSVSINSIGNIIAVGAPFSNVDGKQNSGVVRIYENTNNSWFRIGSDLSGTNGEQFGYSVSINSIGNIIAVGAPFSNVDGKQNSGVVRIYENTNNSWFRIGSDLSGTNGEQFGYSVSINSIGNIIAVGAPFSDINETDSGVVRIYDFIDSTWQQKGQLITGESSGDQSGYSVSLSKDGSTVAIGAIYNDGNGNGNESGHVRVYYNDGYWWQKLGNDIDGVVYNANSCWPVSLNNDGTRVIIGQSSINMNIVKIYEYDALINVDWIELGQTIYGKNILDKFGYSVGMNGIGDKIIVGSPEFDSNGMKNNGKVYVYELETNYHNSNIDVSGGATFSSDVNILGNVSVYNSNLRIVDGSVGIHTNTPQAPLDVSATSIFRDTITAEDISLNGNLEVHGNALFNSNIDVSSGFVSLTNTVLQSETGNSTVPPSNVSTINELRLGLYGTGLDDTVRLFTENRSYPEGNNEVEQRWGYAIVIRNKFSIRSYACGEDASHVFTSVYNSTSSSDDRLKFNETLITDALASIRQLQPVAYDKADDFNESSSTLRRSGFIAQEVHTIPALAHTVVQGDEHREWSLFYEDIFTHAVAAIKELDATVQNQQIEINELNTKISNLEAENISLKEDNTLLKQENTLIKSKLNELLAEAGKETI